MNTNELLLGKLLGELYRIEKSMNMPCPVNDATIFGLLSGMQNVIDEQLDEISCITSDKVNAVADVLTPYWQNPQLLKDFKGYYDIEDRLKQKGVDRGESIVVLKYFKSNGRFVDIIEKMDSSDSPSECRTFELNDWDK